MRWQKRVRRRNKKKKNREEKKAAATVTRLFLRSREAGRCRSNFANVQLSLPQSRLSQQGEDRHDHGRQIPGDGGHGLDGDRMHAPAEREVKCGMAWPRSWARSWLMFESHLKAVLFSAGWRSTKISGGKNAILNISRDVPERTENVYGNYRPPGHGGIAEGK